MISEDVRSLPSFWKNLPILSRVRGLTIAGSVFLRKDIYEDVKSNNLSPLSLSVLVHEQTHTKRIRKIGLLKFSFLYLFSPKFRFSEELEANKQAFKVLKKYKQKVDLDRKARALSSWIYFWSTSYQVAKKELEKAWRQA